MGKNSIELDQGDFLKEIEIELKNQSKFPVEGIMYSLNVEANNNLGAGDWFKFDLTTPINLAQRRGSGDEQNIRIIPTIPVSAKADTIQLETRFYTDFWDSGPQIITIYLRPKTIIELSSDELSAKAGEKLAAHGIHNVTLETGDAARGWEQHAPYDAIAITGSLPLLPDSFSASLKNRGRLIAVVGDAPIMEVILITRLGEAEWSRESLFETELPPLLNAPQPERFTL